MASIAKRQNGQYRARYRDGGGREHARHFARKVDAQRWLDEQTAAIVTGQWADPRAGKVTVREYAQRWQAAQAWRPNTRHRVGYALSLHVLPTFGDRPIGSVRRSEVQAWLAGLRAKLGLPGSVKAVYAVLRGLMRAAVLDRVIVTSPCDGVSAPVTVGKTLTIPSAADVAALADELPEHLSAVPYVAAGLGLRLGEVFGLAVSDVDFLGRRVSVARQLDDGQMLGPLKTASSYRTVPLPDVVSVALAEHVKRTGRRDGLVFATPAGEPVKRNTFGRTWRCAVEQVGLRGLRLHDLRHAYASALIAAGESVKVVQTRMGHASAMVTLDVYGHLFPDSDDRTRAAVDAYLGNPADSARTQNASAQATGTATDFLK